MRERPQRDARAVPRCVRAAGWGWGLVGRRPCALTAIEHAGCASLAVQPGPGAQQRVPGVNIPPGLLPMGVSRRKFPSLELVVVLVDSLVDLRAGLEEVHQKNARE